MTNHWKITEKTCWIRCGVCFFLMVLSWGVFSQILTFDFVNYDDDRYVYADPLISAGVTAEGLRRILTQPHNSNWHPLTSFSHMLDCQLYSLNPAGHHFGNLLLHTATGALLFLVLQAMTGSLWRSAFAAVWFAIHPLRAESVAWISERKDVLSGFFFVLMLGAYLRYIRRPFSLKRYVPVAVLFLLGLLAKPMLVTAPFVLLLLDGWPLNRFQAAKTKRDISRLFIEKVPLFLLSAVFCAITIRAQQQALFSIEELPIRWRIENAVLSYAVYIRQFVFPSGLAVLYPATGEALSGWAVGGSLAGLTGITFFAIKNRQKKPYLLTGWLWYLGMLVPVIGILQVGKQAYADRYTYLPQIGLCLLLAWLAGDWAVTRRRRVLTAIAAAVLLIGLAGAARRQTGFWKNSHTLWSRTLLCTKNNAVAQSNLGVVLFIDGSTGEAIRHFEESLRIEPGRAEVQNNLAAAYADAGRYPEAV
ncbi:MAG: tetratricopeptide repeat protein, partial [Pontiellaceae bacterium]|nr:tetratricopeptide repeat protein [Pontiellaceae bacterium]